MKTTKKCDVCKMEMHSGMTDNEASFHCHEGRCFHRFMDKTYGKGKWMALGNDQQDGLGGYYIATSDDAECGFEGTGIFYTEWEDDDEETE